MDELTSNPSNTSQRAPHLRPGDYGGQQFGEGMEQVLSLLKSDYAAVLEPYLENRQYVIDTGAAKTITSAGRAVETCEHRDLSSLATVAAAAATEAAFDLTGMQIAYVFQEFAELTAGREYLTPVQLFRFLETMFRQVGERYHRRGGADLRTPVTVSLSDTALSPDRSVSFALLTAFQAVHALSVIAQSEVPNSAPDQNSPVTPDHISPALPAFLCLLAGLCLGLADQSTTQIVGDALDEAFSDLPRLRPPAPVTYRAQRLATVIFNVNGPRGTLSALNGENRGKESVFAVGQTDAFGWEEWRLLQRSNDPFFDIPKLPRYADVMVFAPQLPQVTPEVRPSNVVLLHRPRPRIQPFLLALTRSFDIARELVLSGVSVILNPREPQLLTAVLRNLTGTPYLLLAGDEGAADLARRAHTAAGLRGNLPLVTCKGELQLLHLGISATRPLFAAGTEDAQELLLEEVANARQRYWETSVGTTPVELDSRRTVARLFEEKPDGALRVLAATGGDNSPFSAVESWLPEQVLASAPLSFYAGTNEIPVVSYSW